MVVVNIVGFHYKVVLKSGREIIIPNDNLPHEIPDEVGDHKFENVFRILVPPKKINVIPEPFIYKRNDVVNVQLYKVPEIIEIDLEDEIEPKEEIVIDVPVVEVLKEEIKLPPLKGIRIKKGTREKLIKRGKSRNKKEVTIIKEELTDGNQ